MIYGRMEVAFFQLTPSGAARLQSGFPSRVHPETKRALSYLQRLGGTAEWDELKMMAGINPTTLGSILRRSIDAGWVKPIGMSKE